MNTKMRFRMRTVLAGLALSCAAVGMRAADPAPARDSVEELYPGEMADTGPQFLLLPVAQRPTRWTAWGRADLSWTDNATFKDVNPHSSNVTSVQAGLDARLLTRELGGGRLTLAAGGRGQIFRYGFLGGGNKVIDFLQIDRNNFDLVGAGARVAWQRGDWLFSSGLQGALLRNRSAGRTFYRELAWDVGAYRQWRTVGGSTLTVGADLVRYFTWTDTYGLLPSGWNDRAEGSLSAVWTMPVRERLAWRSTVRAQYADYTHADRHRLDKTGVIGTELVWTVRERLEVRLFVAHESRDSDEVGISDYRRWEAGSGAGMRWEF